MMRKEKKKKNTKINEIIKFWKNGGKCLVIEKESYMKEGKWKGLTEEQNKN